MEEVELGERIHNTKLEFKLCPDLWDPRLFDWSSSSVEVTKFLNDLGDEMHEDMTLLPNRKGGIYFFYIKTNILPNTEYLVYIGRAHISTSQNLKKRCRSYFQKYPNERPKINRMIREWGPFLHLRYIPMDNNEEIDQLEAKLISALLPPFNDEIPDKRVRSAVNAF